MTVAVILALVFVATIPASLLVLAWALCTAASLGDEQVVDPDPFDELDRLWAA